MHTHTGYLSPLFMLTCAILITRTLFQRWRRISNTAKAATTTPGSRLTTANSSIQTATSAPSATLPTALRSVPKYVRTTVRFVMKLLRTLLGVVISSTVPARAEDAVEHPSVSRARSLPLSLSVSRGGRAYADSYAHHNAPHNMPDEGYGAVQRVQQAARNQRSACSQPGRSAVVSLARGREGQPHLHQHLHPRWRGANGWILPASERRRRHCSLRGTKQAPHRRMGQYKTTSPPPALCQRSLSGTDGGHHTYVP